MRCGSLIDQKKEPQVERGRNSEMKILSLFFIRVESVFHPWLLPLWLDPMNRVIFRLAWPDLKLGKLLMQALGQLLDAEAFARVVSRQHTGETVSLGGKIIVKTGFAGD